MRYVGWIHEPHPGKFVLQLNALQFTFGPTSADECVAIADRCYGHVVLEPPVLKGLGWRVAIDKAYHAARDRGKCIMEMKA